MKTIDVPVTGLTETMEALATPFKAAIPDDLFAGLASFMKPTEATLTQISDFAEVKPVASCIGNDAAKTLLTRRISSVFTCQGSFPLFINIIIDTLAKIKHFAKTGS